MIPPAILSLVGLLESALLSLISHVWIAVEIVPDLWLARRLSSKQAVYILRGTQAVFSLALAAMGAMMIFGKAV